MTASFSKSGGPVLDEATFQKLLAAAYVLQEHHDQTKPAIPAETKAESSDTDSDTSILAQIVETQHEIQANHLDVDGTTSVVMERIVKITGAQGAAIGILEEGMLHYRAARGILIGQVGKTVRPEAALCSSTLLHDMILRCPDAGTDFRVNPEIAKRLGIASFISVPVLHNGKTGGALELAFVKPNAFHDQDVRTCQLMAGLVTETLTHTAEEEWRKGVAAERASMLEVLEKIKPQLARLAGSPDAALALSKSRSEAAEPVLAEAPCQNCGNELAAGEVFCGSCGTSRAAVPGKDLQSKWATLWNLKQATEGFSALPEDVADSVIQQSSALASDETTADKLEASASLTQQFSESSPLETSKDSLALSDNQADGLTTPEPTEDALVPVPPAKVEPRVWMRSIAVSPPAVQLRGFWQKAKVFARTHRGDLALGASFVLFLITIIWAVSVDHSTTSAATGAATPPVAGAQAKPKRKPAPPAPKLSFFEELLVNMGLAEPPPAPSYSGNPNIPVWVDVHTALYYCPGTDLYGKTPQGKIASQRDAQQDQFEPASRKVCD
jgi:hypothetical protein